MERVAALLPPIPEPPPTAPEVVFLTGRRFWFQTAFCFWSLCRAAETPLRGVFFDDRTLDAGMCAEARRLFPGSRIHRAEQTEAALDRDLPASRFPTLRARRLVYPNLRKLTDVHAGASGWKLVLDSDMLFFRRPVLLLEWLAHPSLPLHMADVRDSYGYSAGLLASLAGAAPPSKVNVGLCGIRSDRLDWDRLEHWCSRLQEAEGTSYYQEQALVALLCAGGETVCAPPDDYRLMPGEEECLRPTAVMHHYVDLSKRGYFRHAWRRVLP
jgi:hypothetical protein